MDIDNPDAKDDLKNLIWSWNIPNINANNLIPDSLSWTRNDARWYANKYYEDTLEEYVDIAKEWLSWVKENIKWFYNDSVDELWNTVTNEINTKIVEWLDKIKVK